MLSYQDILDTPYVDADVEVTMTPNELTLLVFLLSLAQDPAMWTDYAEYQDDIDALVSGSIVGLTEDV